MHLPAIVPELYVTDLEASRRFYTAGIGFEVAYARPAERFVCLQLGESQLLLEEPASFGEASERELQDGRWVLAPMEAPFGRGVNLQISVPSVEAAAERLAHAGHPLVLDPHERSYEVSGTSHRFRVLLVCDPDGYLIRLCESMHDHI